MNTLHIALAVPLLLVVVGLLALFAGALVSVLRSRLSAGMKLVWGVIIFMAPFLGAAAWFVIGRRQPASSTLAR